MSRCRFGRFPCGLPFLTCRILTGIVPRSYLNGKAWRSTKETQLDKTEVRTMIIGQSRGQPRTGEADARRPGEHEPDQTAGRPHRAGLRRRNAARVGPPSGTVGLVLGRAVGAGHRAVYGERGIRAAL